MKREQILAMEAGLKLNAMVGEIIIGWTEIDIRDSVCVGLLPGTKKRDNLRTYLPDYSRNMLAAWEVIEKTMSLKFRYVLRGNFEANGLHSAAFDEQDWADANPLYQSGLCKSLPEAICKAALIAILSERGELEK